MKLNLYQPFTQRSTGLSRKKTPPEAGKARTVQTPQAPAAPAVSGHWETRVEPFLAKYARLLVVGFVLLGIGRIVSTYHVFATTADEPAHIACGLQYVAQHIYRYESQHPPLTRAMIALLPYLSGTRPRGKPTFQLEGWDLITYQHHGEQTLMRMRLGNLPFFVLGCLVVFYWGRRYFGIACGVVATCLFTLIPPILAHAGLATTDMGLAACLGAAFLAMLIWAGEPTLIHGAVFGFSMALALLSKFTALGFFPVGAGLALAFYLATLKSAGHVFVTRREKLLAIVEGRN